MNKILYRDCYDELQEKETLAIKDIIYLKGQRLMVVGFEITRFGLMDLDNYVVLSCRFRSLEELTNYIRKVKVEDDVVHISLGWEWTVYFPWYMKIN